MKQFSLLQIFLYNDHSIQFQYFCTSIWLRNLYFLLNRYIVRGRPNKSMISISIFRCQYFSDYVITYIKLKIRHAHKWLPFWLNYFSSNTSVIYRNVAEKRWWINDDYCFPWIVCIYSLSVYRAYCMLRCVCLRSIRRTNISIESRDQQNKSIKI